MSRAKYICIGIIAIISVVVLVAACESSRQSGQPASEYITGISPESGATDIAFDAVITVTFNTQIDETTVTTDNVTLTRANGVVDTNGTVSYEATTKTLTFTPSFPLNSETEYTLDISDAVVTKANGGYQSSFTTQIKPIIYHSAPTTGSTDWQIWTMNADGTENTQLTNLTTHAAFAGFFSRSWSPGYSYIAFRAENLSNSDWDLFIMGGDGSNLVNVTEAGTGDHVEEYVEWAKDGSKIYFLWRIEGTTNRYNVWSSEPDGTLEQLTDLASPLSAHRMTMSPDGSTLLYLVRDTSSDRKVIYEMDLTADPPTSETFSNLSEALSVLQMQYSADGSQVYFTAGEPGSGDNANIYRMVSSGGTAEALTDVGDDYTIWSFAASPDETQLAYVNRAISGSVYYLYLMDLSDNTADLIRNTDEQISGDIIWSPDGTKLAFGQGDMASIYDLWIWSSSTGFHNTTNFFTNGDVYVNGMWSTNSEDVMFYYNSGSLGVSVIAKTYFLNDTYSMENLTQLNDGNCRLLDWWRSEFPVTEM